MVEKYKFYSTTLFTCLWIQLCYGFFTSELIPALSKVQPFVYLLIDGIFIVMGLAFLRSRRDIMVFVSFLLVAGLSALLNHQGAVAFFNGFRPYAGLLFAVPIFRYFLTSKHAARFVASMDRQIYILLWLQVPTIVWEFILHGAGDAVGGTLGNGGSGMISTLICFLSFYLLIKAWNPDKSYFENIRAHWIYVFLLFPTFLNETKITLIILPFYFILLMKINRTFLLRILAATPFMIIAMIGLGIVYLHITHQEDNNVFSVEFMQGYFVGEDLEQLAYLAVLVDEGVIETDNQWVSDLPRFGRMYFVPEALRATKGGLWLGAGIGQFKGQTVLKMSEFRRKYNWLLRGSALAIFYISIELGILGTLWLCGTMLLIIFGCGSNPRYLGLRMLLLLVFLLTLAYSPQLFISQWIFLFVYIAMASMQPRPTPRANESLPT